MNTQIAKRDELPLDVATTELPVVKTPMDLMALAVTQKADIGTIERLAALAETFDRKRAKREFDAAMESFQAECPVILKTVNGAQGKYKFAPLDHVVEQVKPILQKNGFSFTINGEMEPGFVKAVVTIKHRGGHEIPSEFKVPVDTRNNVMSAPQQYGGAMTFAKRYAFCNAFGILTADEDHDGQTARSKLPGWLRERADQQEEQKRGGPKLAGEGVEQTAYGDKPKTNPLKAKLWEACKPIRGDAKSWDSAEKWMVSKKILAPGQKVSALSDDELAEAYEKTTIELQGD